MDEIEAGITYINSGTIAAQKCICPLAESKTRATAGASPAGRPSKNTPSGRRIYVDFSGRLQKAQGID
jgi:hypothetical protein